MNDKRTIVRVTDLVEEIDAILVEDGEFWQQMLRSYSAALLSNNKNKIAQPFEYDGAQYVDTGGSSTSLSSGGWQELRYAYQVVPRNEFKDEAYGQYDHPDFPEGYYHRRYAYFDGQMYVLLGPKLTFVKINEPTKGVA